MTPDQFAKLMDNPMISVPLFSVWFLFLIWSLAWKGVALWKASQNCSKVWFVVLLVVNTMGILEILYIFWFSKKGCCCCEKNNKEQSPINPIQ